MSYDKPFFKRLLDTNYVENGVLSNFGKNVGGEGEGRGCFMIQKKGVVH